MIEEINNHWNTDELEKPFGRGINFQIEVDNINLLLTKIKEANYPLFRPLENNYYRKNYELLGNKEFLIQDPDGYLLRFSEDLDVKKL